MGSDAVLCCTSDTARQVGRTEFQIVVVVSLVVVVRSLALVVGSIGGHRQEQTGAGTTSGIPAVEYCWGMRDFSDWMSCFSVLMKALF